MGEDKEEVDAFQKRCFVVIDEDAIAWNPSVVSVEEWAGTIVSSKKHDNKDALDVDANNNIEVVGDRGIEVIELRPKGLLKVHEGHSQEFPSHHTATTIIDVEHADLAPLDPDVRGCHGCCLPLPHLPTSLSLLFLIQCHSPSASLYICVYGH